MNYFVFQVSDQLQNGKEITAQEVFKSQVVERSVWGFGYHTANRKSIRPGDKVLFYTAGANNQTFIGSATLDSGAYTDETRESANWFLDPETLRIDLKDIVVFSEPKLRSAYHSIEWRPTKGGSSKISERDYWIINGTQPDRFTSGFETEEGMDFALEKYLEEFMVDNWKKIDFGEQLDLFEDKDGNIGQQYYAEDVGYIDLLAKDRHGNFVVIELKKGRKNDEVVGQILRYMGYVRENLANNGEAVRGYIVVGEKDEKLEYAIKEISDKVKMKQYRATFKLL